jgi:D-arabinose 1-dehydrogenase-like Zn-dependent alcohol dehydrogenase
MRAGRIQISTRRFGVVDVPIPKPSPLQVLIKVKAAGVCLSDVHLLTGILTPGYLVGDVVTMGHEVSGIIEDVGALVTEWSPGDRVVICAGVHDEQNRVTTLGFDYDGGFAEYVVSDAATLVAIPDNVPFEQACIIPDAVSTPWAAITQTAKVKAGERVAVFGIGGLGIHAVQLLRIVGVSLIVALDPLEDARARALARGADIALDPLDPGFPTYLKKLVADGGVDVVFDFAGVASARSQGFRLLAEGGRLVIVGLANESIVIPNDIAFAYKRSQLLGHYGSDPIHTQELVNLIREGRLDLSSSVSEIMSLEELPEAFKRLEGKINNPVRIVIKP